MALTKHNSPGSLKRQASLNAGAGTGALMENVGGTGVDADTGACGLGEDHGVHAGTGSRRSRSRSRGAVWGLGTGFVSELPEFFGGEEVDVRGGALVHEVDQKDFIMGSVTDFYMNGSCVPGDDPPASRGRSASEEWGNANAMHSPDLHPKDDVRYDFSSLLTCWTTSWPHRFMLPDVCRMLPGTRVDKWMGVVRRNDILLNREVEEELQRLFTAIAAQHPSITVESDILESPTAWEASEKARRFILKVVSRGGVPYVGICVHPPERLEEHRLRPNTPRPIDVMHVVWVSLSSRDTGYWEKVIIQALGVKLMNKSPGGEGAAKQLVSFAYIGVHWPPCA